MGCKYSSPKVGPISIDRYNKASPNGHTDFLRTDYNYIMQGLTRFPNPINLSPVACYHDLAVPLAISPVLFDLHNNNSMSLPLMGFSRAGNGKILLIGQIQILVQCVPEVNELSGFLESISKWTANFPKGFLRVLLYDIPYQFSQKIKLNLEYFGSRVTLASSDILSNTNLNYDLIICQSDFLYPHIFESFIDNGGGLICCTPHSFSDFETDNLHFERFRMNTLTSRYGISFSPCRIQLGSISSPFFGSPRASRRCCR